ncbi:unnamed protein product [Bursaphelenchus xylophilus]|uniref:(pine wood nematode) hypothetical protein n=1 Tax=Bursaphelenchus xylophilus TaxID=6326 RepID=A0A1I7RTR8_BURXY|nr:unnamed protein product [Bursaphelenchus xylophilus]CAG9122183.1 unnamed protein product [Bursaphelenchus xylophilus]
MLLTEVLFHFGVILSQKGYFPDGFNPDTINTVELTHNRTHVFANESSYRVGDEGVEYLNSTVEVFPLPALDDDGTKQYDIQLFFSLENQTREYGFLIREEVNDTAIFGTLNPLKTEVWNKELNQRPPSSYWRADFYEKNIIFHRRHGGFEVRFEEDLGNSNKHLYRVDGEKEADLTYKSSYIRHDDDFIFSQKDDGVDCGLATMALVAEMSCGVQSFYLYKKLEADGEERFSQFFHARLIEMMTEQIHDPNLQAHLDNLYIQFGQTSVTSSPLIVSSVVLLAAASLIILLIALIIRFGRSIERDEIAHADIVLQERRKIEETDD